MLSSSDGSQRVSTEIMVRDIFVAGLGDSVASVREIRTADPLGDAGSASAPIWARRRRNTTVRAAPRLTKGGRACEAPDLLPVWQRQSALWFNSARHRSLYSYQPGRAGRLPCSIRISR